MYRITVAEAERDFANLVSRVRSEGIAIELEQDNKVVACLSPARPQSPLKIRDLNAFLQSLPKLGDDADAFLDDVQDIRRSMPTEVDPWA